MSIDRPRRIFRSSSRSALSRTLGRVVALGLFAACCALLAMGVSNNLLGHASPGPRVIMAPAANVAVVDGETLSLSGVVVRLSDVHAPARDASCAAGDCGQRAIAALAGLVRDRSVECYVSGHDEHGRPAGRCLAGGQDVNVALVDMGWARATTAALQPEEADARSHRRGIWLAD